MPPPLAVVRLLQDQYLDAIVTIHRAVLGYTLNSRLGRAHLAHLYHAMSRDSDCYVGVALSQDRPVGVVSGSLDLERAESRLFRSIGFGPWANIVWQVLRSPSLVREWRKGQAIGRPVYRDRERVAAILTTLAVDPRCQRVGIGRQLISELEAFFAARNVHCYRLDTLADNRAAREFYRKAGFEELEQREDSIVLVKKTSP